MFRLLVLECLVVSIYSIPFNYDQLLSVEKMIKPEDRKVWTSFAGFVTRYDRKYKHENEVLHRFKAYKENVEIIKMLQDNEQGTAVYGENKFMDLSKEEFKRIYLPSFNKLPKSQVNPEILSQLELNQLDSETIPESFDWREHGVITPVKNQKLCGSCWAFSVIGNIEGQYAIKTKKLISLSEQQVIDCDKVNNACDGGLPMDAYYQIIKFGGLETEEDYPYVGREDTSTCMLNKSRVAVYIDGYLHLPQDEKKIAAYLFKHEPLSVAVNAEPMHLYVSGIMRPWKPLCNPSHLNHAVLLVGYGKEDGLPFWIIKNSWGVDKNDNGYVRLYRGENVCGIQEMATTALITS